MSEPNEKYNRILNSVYKRIHEAERFEDVLPRIEADVLALLGAERLAIYKRDASRQELIAYYKAGDDLDELRVPITPNSIAGYVAMTQQHLRIDDVRDQEFLASVDPRLRFDETFDRQTGFHTRAMVIVPIVCKESVLGVLQIINRVAGDFFSDQDVIHALAIGQVLGQHFASEVPMVAGPFDLLVRKGLISLEDLGKLQNKAAADSASITRLLIKVGEVKPDDIGLSLEHYYQVPYMKYDPAFKPDPELLAQFNITYLVRNLWVPFRGSEGELIILLDDPSDSNRLMELQYLLKNRPMQLRVGLPEDILHYLGIEVNEETNEVNLEDILGRLANEAVVEEDVAEKQATAAAEEDLLNENQPAIIQLVNRLVVDAVDLRASDIHIEPGKDNTPALVRLRIDGECREHLRIPASHVNAVLARIKVMSRLDIAEKRMPQDGKMTLKLRGQPLELRIATIPTVNGESAVMRLLAASAAMPLAKLNLAPENLAAVKELCQRPHGILLVVGPTGSGKTTTLHAVLGHINRPDLKIWTAEDPVEITQPGLQQVQVQSKIGLTFAAVLRSFLRADPNVILIGEMRDQETAHAGIEASLTGHLVFSTLHTNSAPETIVRLLDMGLDPMNFADALVGVLAQRLVRTLCRRCRQPYHPEPEEVEYVVNLYGEKFFPELGVDRANLRFCKAVGCDSCNSSGYKGRTGIHELLRNTKEMKRLIATRATVAEIRDLALRQGMRTLLQDGLRKVLAGQTDLEQVRKQAVE